MRNKIKQLKEDEDGWKIIEESAKRNNLTEKQANKLIDKVRDELPMNKDYTEKMKNWEKDLDGKFFCCRGLVPDIKNRELKDFIRSILKDQREEILKERNKKG